MSGTKLCTSVVMSLFGVFALVQPARAVPFGRRTTTILTIAPVNSGSAGNVVALTAVVTAATPVRRGTVLFCDATAPRCVGSTAFGSAQLTSSGTATIRKVFGVGSYSIEAVFVATNLSNTSKSSTQSFTVNGNSSYPSVTVITVSGSAGSYTLMEMLTVFGKVAPTGIASFLDASNGNSVVATVALDPSTLAFSMIPAAGSPIATGSFPWPVVSADLDNDGKLDLAVANGSDNTLNVFLGNGDGTFRNPNTYSVDAFPMSLAAGDLNHDGKLDLVVANSGSNTVSILLGNGDGTFQAQVLYTVGNQPGAISVADLNRDGILDLLAVNGSDNTVSVLLGNGDGTFQPQLVYATGAAPYAVAWGDFNGDGILDVVVANSNDNTVSVLLGNGDGTFQSQVTYPTGGDPQTVAIGDFNGDGFLDLDVTNVNDNNMSILLGNGDGTFQSQLTDSVGSYPSGLVVSDFNGDGKVDVATANQGDNTVSLLYGNGDGTFQAQQVYPTGNGPTKIAAGDFNGDGLTDLVTTNYADNTVSLLLGVQTESMTATGVSVIGVGTHNVSASYAGDASRAASQSSTVPLVGGAQASTTVSLSTTSPNPVDAGQSVIFMATVSPAPTGTSLGSVNFENGSTLLGTGAVNSSGVATWTTNSLSAGSYIITAVYLGNTGFAGSTSAGLSFTVETSQGFTVTGPQSSVTVSAGGSATFSINVPPLGNAFNHSVTMSASGLPAGAVAIFSPATVTPGTAGGQTVLSVQTSAQSADLPKNRNPGFPFAPFTLAAGLCVMAGSRRRIAKSLPMLLALATVAAATLWLTGCTAGFIAKLPPPIQPHTYVLTVTGTSGLQHASTAVTLIVQ
jgi:hypothetical protein